MKRGLKWTLALVIVAGCGGAGDPTTNTLYVNLRAGNTFSPQTVTVKGGRTVTWLNQDAMAHTITRDTAAGPNSDTQYPNGLATGQTYFWQVPQAPSGTRFYYHCRFHGTAGNGTDFGTGMTGVIIVE